VAMTEAVGSQLASTTASDRAPIIGALLNYGLLVSTPESQPVPNTDQRGRASNRRRFNEVVSFAWPVCSPKVLLIFCFMAFSSRLRRRKHRLLRAVARPSPVGVK
jgi:hypothetical protein